MHHPSIILDHSHCHNFHLDNWNRYFKNLLQIVEKVRFTFLFTEIATSVVLPDMFSDLLLHLAGALPKPSIRPVSICGKFPSTSSPPLWYTRICKTMIQKQHCWFKSKTRRWKNSFFLVPTLFGFSLFPPSPSLSFTRDGAISPEMMISLAGFLLVVLPVFSTGHVTCAPGFSTVSQLQRSRPCPQLGNCWLRTKYMYRVHLGPTFASGSNQEIKSNT